MPFGKLYMIPCPIAEERIGTIPVDTLTMIHSLDHFIVERATTARRFLKLAAHPTNMQEIEIMELDKNNPAQDLNQFLAPLKKGISIGIISEAGCPGIADPGALAVRWCHENKIQVVPMVGPSSILLALMASGFSGQQFAFHGYLPVKKPELISALKKLESSVRKTGRSEIFMETPYRNHGLLETVLKSLSPQTKLCVAVDINGRDEWIITKTLQQWKNQTFDIHKKPAIFVLGF